MAQACIVFLLLALSNLILRGFGTALRVRLVAAALPLGFGGAWLLARPGLLPLPETPIWVFGIVFAIYFATVILALARPRPEDASAPAAG